MDWTRGFLRLWVVGTILWIGYLLLTLDPVGAYNKYTGATAFVAKIPAGAEVSVLSLPSFWWNRDPLDVIVGEGLTLYKMTALDGSVVEVYAKGPDHAKGAVDYGTYASTEPAWAWSLFTYAVWGFAVFSVLVPLFVLGVAWVLRWIARGFMRSA